MILFLYGKDTFRSKAQLNKMAEKFKVDRDPQGLNLVRIDCVAGGVKDALNQLLAAPFLAEKRMVVVEGLMQVGDDDLCQEILKRIEEGTVPTDLIWIFFEEVKPKKKHAKALYARLQQEKYAEEFEALEGAAFAGWVASLAEEFGSNMTRQAAARIVQDAGKDSWKAATLVQTVASYKAGEKIEVSDVDDFVSASVDATVDLEVTTSSGGEEHNCSYSVNGGVSLEFEEQGDVGLHEQVVNVSVGDNVVSVRCWDEAGNSAEDSVSFNVAHDTSTPQIARVWQSGGQLYVVTAESAECKYTQTDCGYAWVNGTSMGTGEMHSISVLHGESYYIKCADALGNVPSGCSITVRTL